MPSDEEMAAIELLAHRVMVSVADLPPSKHLYAMQVVTTMVSEALAGSIDVQASLKSEVCSTKFRQAVLDYDSD